MVASGQDGRRGGESAVKLMAFNSYRMINFISCGLSVVAIAALWGCEHRSEVDISTEEYSVSSSKAESCSLFSEILNMDNRLIEKKLSVRGEKVSDEKPFEDIMPGGKFYATATAGLRPDSPMSGDVTDKPMQHYYLSRVYREAGDSRNEIRNLMLSALPQESYVEMQRNGGRFHVSMKKIYGSYLPAICRLQKICADIGESRSVLSFQCNANW